MWYFGSRMILFRIYSDCFLKNVAVSLRKGKAVRSCEVVTEFLNSIYVNFRTVLLIYITTFNTGKWDVYWTLCYLCVSCDSYNKQICFLKQH